MEAAIRSASAAALEDVLAEVVPVVVDAAAKRHSRLASSVHEITL
jgi:hypothetical protein